MADISKIVTQIPRKGAEAELPGDFPLRDQPAQRIEDVKPLQAPPKRIEPLAIESLSAERAEADAIQRKRMLPPLSLAPKRRAKTFLTFDQSRRDIVAGQAEAEQNAQARAELAKTVAAMPKRWERKP